MGRAVQDSRRDGGWWWDRAAAAAATCSAQDPRSLRRGRLRRGEEKERMPVKGEREAEREVRSERLVRERCELGGIKTAG